MYASNIWQRAGCKLQPVPGMDTRPTTDRVKESVFNIIQNEIRGARVLDLFAGTGQLGIEALSRGSRRRATSWTAGGRRWTSSGRASKLHGSRTAAACTAARQRRSCPAAQASSTI